MSRIQKGCVKITYSLKKVVPEYISKEDDKYIYPNILTFSNSPILERLKKLLGVKNEKFTPA